jgi:hypothetical protein
MHIALVVVLPPDGTHVSARQWHAEKNAKNDDAGRRAIRANLGEIRAAIRRAPGQRAFRVAV